MNLATKLLGLTLLVTAVGLSSCSRSRNDPGPPTQADALNEVAGMLRDYSAVSNRPPSKPADLARFQNLYPLGYHELRAGNIVVVWGGKIAGEGGGGQEVIIAYEKKAPTEGGAVLLENGTIKQVTVQEFNALKPK